MLGRTRNMLCAAALAAAATPAFAVTPGGELDGNAHPYVGLMVARDAAGNGWRCSGALLSATIFLTAGHCTEGAVSVDLWFDADVESGIPGNGYPFNSPLTGDAFTHPQYNPNAFFLFDLGVVVLHQPVVLSQYAALPTLNVLDALATQRGHKDQTFTAVGYGLQEIHPIEQFASALRVRMFARPHLIAINVPGFTGDFSMLLSNNRSTGGTCFGDSGGPNLIGTSNVIGGVTSFGLNGQCAGTGGVYRVDRADDLDWIASFF